MRSVVARIVRLERAERCQNGGILVATDGIEAERRRAANPKALIIVTGVPRSSSRGGDAR